MSQEESSLALSVRQLGIGTHTQPKLGEINMRIIIKDGYEWVELTDILREQRSVWYLVEPPVPDPMEDEEKA